MKPAIPVGIACIGLGLLIGSLTVGCSNKAQQVNNDSKRTSTQNDGAAQIITMPDGFSNVASKCDGPNRVYVVFHNDNAYGSVAVVPFDPRCASASPEATISGP